MTDRFPWTRINPALPPVEYDAAFVAKVKSRCRILPNGCWEYLGTRNEQGYGFMNYRGKPWGLHRIMLVIAKGQPPTPKHKSCHECDFPPCCNPEHLFWGTQKANGEDMAAKGRAPKQQNTACPRGHSFVEHGRVEKNGKRSCRTCERAKTRIYAGWPEDLAYSVPAGAVGFVPDDLIRVTPPKRRARGRTHCVNGHLLEGDNIYPKTNGSRQCRICYNASQRRNRRAKGLYKAGYENKPGAEQ
jgi:hypothetical protein